MIALWGCDFSFEVALELPEDNQRVAANRFSACSEHMISFCQLVLTEISASQFLCTSIARCLWAIHHTNCMRTGNFAQRTVYLATWCPCGLLSRLQIILWTRDPSHLSWRGELVETAHHLLPAAKYELDGPCNDVTPMKTLCALTSRCD